MFLDADYKQLMAMSEGKYWARISMGWPDYGSVMKSPVSCGNYGNIPDK
jgi:hypothetical protein